uniref:Ovule protein n=1 Tax=Brugia timori TaxID=42155 RepID=A0A0R3RCL3_9BILA
LKKSKKLKTFQIWKLPEGQRLFLIFKIGLSNCNMLTKCMVGYRHIYPIPGLSPCIKKLIPK